MKTRLQKQNIRSYEGNRLEIYHDAVTAYQAIIAAIKEAKQTIYIANFCFQDGEVFDWLKAEIIKKATQGVEVRIIADHYGSARVEPQKINQLRQAGVEWVWFQPWKPLLFWRYNRRMHKKLVIIDAQTGFTGGVGFADFWAEPDNTYPKEWRDTHFKLSGPILVGMLASFTQSWNEFNSGKLGSRRDRTASKPTGLIISAINSKPEIGMTPIGHQYCQLIDSATHSIKITTAYFGPNQQLRQALVRAAERGVKVEILVNGPYTTHFMAAEAGRHWYKLLLDRGVHIYEYQPTKIHSKLMTIDGRLATIGSANFNFRSFYHDEEFNLIVEDAATVKELDHQFAQDIKLARTVTADSWKIRPWRTKIRQFLASTMRYFF